MTIGPRATMSPEEWNDVVKMYHIVMEQILKISEEKRETEDDYEAADNLIITLTTAGAALILVANDEELQKRIQFGIVQKEGDSDD